MLHGVETQRAVRQLKREGLRYLYRGLLPPLVSKTVSVSIMFGTFNEYKKLIEAHCPLVPPPFGFVTAAFLAGCTESILTPFERVQMLLQDRQFHGRYNNTFHAVKELKKYGFREYYRGLTPSME